MKTQTSRKEDGVQPAPPADSATSGTRKRKRVMLQWPSGFRALRKIVNWGCRYECNNPSSGRAGYDNENQCKPNNTEEDVHYEGGDSKENQVAPMVQFYPEAGEQAKTIDHSEKDSQEHGLVEMAQLPKAGDADFPTTGGESKSKCPKFRIGDADPVALEWLDFVQDIFDKFVLTVIIAGLVFFAYYSVEYKAFKPFTVWVLVIAISGFGDIIGNFGASVPSNKCRFLVYINVFTGLACLALSILSFIKCTEHQTVWNAIEQFEETGDATWFLEPANKKWVEEMNESDPDWQDEWVGMTAVDWGHACLCLILSIAELGQAGFVVFLRADGGGELYGQGNEKFKSAQSISTIVQSLVQIMVMGIAWAIEGHLVKADYMAALITTMMATDRFFDHVTNLMDSFFEQGDDEVSCGVLGNQIFKVLHNTGLVLLALYLSSYSQDLYFYIENREIDNLEQLTDPKNWFSNATTVGDYYDLDEDTLIDGADPTLDGNYCTMKPSMWNALGYTSKLVYCTEYKYDQAKGEGHFADVMDFPTFYSDDFHPTSGADWGKMQALWGDVKTNLCPEQCSTPSVHYTTAHPCDPTLCNFHKIVKEGDSQTSVRKIPLALQPLDAGLRMGESVQDENEALLTELQFQKFDLTFLFKFAVWCNAIQAGQSVIGLFVLFRMVKVSCVLTFLVILGGYVALFLDVPLIRSELVWVLALMAAVGTACWFYVRSDRAKGL